MALVDHLTELRFRLVICAVAVSVGALAAFFVYDPILDFLIAPYEKVTGKSTLFITDPLEGFATRLKVSGYTGFAIALPVLLWQLWRFVTPALDRREKRYAIPFVLGSMVLFAMGASIAFLTLPQALGFLVGIGGDNLETLFGPGKYLGLVTLMMIAFGLAFEFPLLLIFLQLVGILRSRQLGGFRRYAIVLIFVFVAVITPSGDPYSLLALAMPMYFFYEGAILIGRLLGK
jgi:sec-independent protein translocase protein TatC